jgi:hypothetical protein
MSRKGEVVTAPAAKRIRVSTEGVPDRLPDHLPDRTIEVRNLHNKLKNPPDKERLRLAVPLIRSLCNELEVDSNTRLTFVGQLLNGGPNLNDLLQRVLVRAKATPAQESWLLRRLLAVLGDKINNDSYREASRKIQYLKTLLSPNSVGYNA